MLKNSISLIETLVSLIILLTVVGGFLKISHSKSRNEAFHTLNELENSFNSKQYQSLNYTNSDIKVTKNGNSTYITVKKYYFDNQDLNVFRYEK